MNDKARHLPSGRPMIFVLPAGSRKRILTASPLFRKISVLFLLTLVAGACHCGEKKRQDRGEGRHPHVEEGMASWYGKEFQGKKTASGEPFNMHELTAAHRTLPFGTKVKVTNLENGKSVVVRINDRGPWKKGRIIDLSYAAAKKIGMIEKGTARVRIEVVKSKEKRP